MSTTPLQPEKASSDKTRKKTPPVTMAKAIPSLDASHDTRKIAAAILEVLAGARTTGDAAAALSVSLPRYYALEARAIAGLVRACEPRKRGKTRSPSKEIERLEKEVKRLEAECARQQSLARAAQRTIGLLPVAPRVSDPSSKSGARKKRRAVARALVAVKALQQAPAGKPIQGTHPAGGKAMP